MESKTRFWNRVLVVLSAANLGAVWFAARPGEPWHATTHAVLALGFGLWAQRRIWLEQAQSQAGALSEGSEAEIGVLQDEVGEMRRELGEVQERLDFTERLLSHVERPPGRPKD